MASPAETPTERHQRLANRQRERGEKERVAAGFIERLATEKAERQKNNKPPTAKELLVSENKEKEEEGERLKVEKQRRDLEQQAEEDKVRKRKAEEEEATTLNTESIKRLTGTERLIMENKQMEEEQERLQGGEEEARPRAESGA